MPSYASRFFLTNTKQTTPALPAQVYDLTEAGAVRGNATTVTYTATAQVVKRVNPYAGNATGLSSVPADNSPPSNFGWRLRTADANSASGEPREIVAGTWVLPLAFTTGNYALLAANPLYRVTAIIYQITSAGVATERGRGGTSQVAQPANTDVSMAVTAVLPKITLAPGDTIQVEWYLTTGATANTLNQVTNNVVTIRTEATYVDLAGALRTVATRSAGDTVAAPADTTQRINAVFRRSTGESSAITETPRRVTAVARPTSESVQLADSTRRVVAAVRASSESIALADSTTRTQATVRRLSETVALADSTRREVTARRFTAEAMAFTDSPLRVATFPRSRTETVALTDTPSRVYLANRTTLDTVLRPVEVVTRLYSASRVASDLVPTPLDTSIKLVTYGRIVRYQFQPGDEPLIDPVKAITGVVRTTEGVIYTGGALVILYRTDTNVAVQTTTSGADGRYAFPRNSYDVAQYYVAAFITTPSAQQAVTERTLVAT